MERGSTLALLVLVGACTGLPEVEMVSPSADALVRGVVRNEQGWELEGLQILALSEEGLGSRVSMTDAKGLYSIDGLSVGTYTIRVSRGSKVVAERQLRIQTNSAVDTHFVVPVQYLDRPDQRGGPIVERHFVTKTRRE